MSKVTEIGRGVHLSMRGIAEETGFDRDTVAARIGKAKVKPSGQRGGHPVYRLRDVLKILHGISDDGEIDPDKLEPFQRKAHYQAELEKLKLGTERGELVPRIQVEAEQARTAKIVAQFCDTLPDVLERDCGAPAHMLMQIERRIDGLREELYNALIEDDDAGDAAGESA